MNAPFEIKLTVEHMRHAIVQHISGYMEKTSASIAEAVRAACDRFDFEAEIKHVTEPLLREAVRDAVQTAFRTAQYNQLIENAVIDAVVAEAKRKAGRR